MKKNREDAMKLGKRGVIMAIIFSFIILPLGSTAMAIDMYSTTKASSGYMTADIVAARPVGIASTILGATAFVIASPFSALGDNFEQSFDELVKKPFLYTFKRPLGIF